MKMPKDNICVLCGTTEDIKNYAEFIKSKAHTFLPICDVCKPEVDSFQNNHCSELCDKYELTDIKN